MGLLFVEDCLPQPARTRYLFFGVAAFSLLLVTLNNTIIAMAIPALERSLDTSLTWVGWTVTAYQLAQIVAMPLIGKLSDELGRKRVFLACLAMFVLGSLLCGLAPNIGLLIVFRVIQAVGGGGLLPSAYGIVSDQFKEGRSQAIGLFASIMPIGGIIGPSVGGWIIENWSWREIFFLNVPIGLAALIAVHLTLRRDGTSATSKRIDTSGLVLFAAAMITLMYGMTLAGNDASILLSPWLWLLLLAAAVLFYLFGRHESRVDHPMVDMHLVLRAPFLPANIYNFLFGAAIFGFLSFVPYYAIEHYHMTAMQTGNILIPRAIGMAGMSTFTSLVLLRLGYRLPMILGMLTLGVGLVLMSLGLSELTIGWLTLDSFWWMAIAVGITGLGMGFASPSSNNATLDLLPEQAAAITGLRSMFRLSGGIIAISSMTLILSFYDDKSAGISTLFLALGILLPLVNVPLCFMIPDTARERHLAQGQQPRPESA